MISNVMDVEIDEKIKQKILDGELVVENDEELVSNLYHCL